MHEFRGPGKRKNKLKTVWNPAFKPAESLAEPLVDTLSQPNERGGRAVYIGGFFCALLKKKQWFSHGSLKNNLKAQLKRILALGTGHAKDRSVALIVCWLVKNWVGSRGSERGNCGDYLLFIHCSS